MPSWSGPAAGRSTCESLQIAVARLTFGAACLQVFPYSKRRYPNLPASVGQGAAWGAGLWACRAPGPTVPASGSSQQISVGQPSPAGEPAGPHCPGGGCGCCAGGDRRLLQGQIAPWLKREIIARLIASPAAGTSSILHPEYFPLEPPRTVQLSQLPGNCLEKDFMVFYTYERKT